MKKPTDTLPVNLQRRRLLCAAGALLISPLAHAGAQREETLADDV
ncbi:TPA: lytic transglycosylase domain-containing protein, partial [Neisseria gonorrhoeae]